MRIDQFLYSAFTRYQQTLSQLEKAAPAPLPEELLQVLLARDAVQEILTKVEHPSTSLLLKLAELDRRLQKHQTSIVRVEDYPHWRNSFQPPDSSWWWHFEISTPHWWERLDWLWNGLTLVFLTISVSLIADAVPLFLSGGLDTIGVLAVIIPFGDKHK